MIIDPPSMTWPDLGLLDCTWAGLYMCSRGPSFSANMYEDVLAVEPDEHALALAGFASAGAASADAATSSALRTTRRTRMATSLLSPTRSDIVASIAARRPTGQRPIITTRIIPADWW